MAVVLTVLRTYVKCLLVEVNLLLVRLGCGWVGSGGCFRDRVIVWVRLVLLTLRCGLICIIGVLSWWRSLLMLILTLWCVVILDTASVMMICFLDLSIRDIKHNEWVSWEVLVMMMTRLGWLVLLGGTSSACANRLLGETVLRSQVFGKLSSVILDFGLLYDLVLVRLGIVACLCSGID